MPASLSLLTLLLRGPRGLPETSTETDIIAVTNATGSFLCSCTDYYLYSMSCNGSNIKPHCHLGKARTNAFRLSHPSTFGIFFRPGSDDQISCDTCMPICKCPSSPFQNESRSTPHCGAALHDGKHSLRPYEQLRAGISRQVFSLFYNHAPFVQVLINHCPLK